MVLIYRELNNKPLSAALRGLFSTQLQMHRCLAMYNELKDTGKAMSQGVSVY